MDLIARKKEREKKREQERIRQLVAEEVFKKPQKAYVPSSKKLTIITFILLLIAVPYIYFTTDTIIRDSCGLMPGVECENLAVTSTQTSFEVHNYLKEEYNITIQLENCDDRKWTVLRPNQMTTMKFDCLSQEDVVRRQIYITYVGFSGLPHNTTGQLVAKMRT